VVVVVDDVDVPIVSVLAMAEENHSGHGQDCDHDLLRQLRE